MSTGHILVLGATAGFTIFLGLPFGRMRRADRRLKAAMSAAATGILVFLLWDVITNGLAPVQAALTSASHGGGSWGRFAWLAIVFGVGITLGMLSLVYYDRMMSRERSKALLGPGAAAAAEYEPSWVAGLSAGRWLALLIATGIGLHNFAEGLAIGQSAATGEISLALALIIGFGLHNATEGFGIVAPLSGDERLPSWRFLALLGLIGGGPTFLGTLVGQSWTSVALSVGFLALAAGSILFVVIELFNINRSFGHRTLVAWSMLGGLFAGFATDFVLKAVGA